MQRSFSALLTIGTLGLAFGFWSACASEEGSTSEGTAGSGPGSGGSGPGSGASGVAGGGGNGGSTGPAKPKDCSFEVAPRPEYTDFSTGKTDVGANPNIRRVRLGLGGNVEPGSKGRADPARTIGFAWQTDDGTLVSEAQWGTTPNPANWPKANRVSGSTWLTPHGITTTVDQRMHEVYVCGLEPATTYYYRVGGGPEGSEVWSDVQSFTTTPAAGADTTVLIGISGDSRGQSNDAWHLAQKRMKLAGVAFQIFSGDFVSIGSDGIEWEKWLDQASADTDGFLTLGQTLILATHGNHEAHSSLFYGNLVLPQDVEHYPEFGELFYSVDVGSVHITVIDDQWLISSGNEDYRTKAAAWLEADLAAADANRDKVPFIVTNHHHGPYSSSTHGDDSDVDEARDYFTPLLAKYRVNLDIAGHDHNYERSKPITGTGSSPIFHADPKDGTTYVICAGVGAPAYGNGTSSFTATSHSFAGSGIGVYAFLRAEPDALTLEVRELRANGTDPLIDTLTIPK